MKILFWFKFYKKYVKGVIDNNLKLVQVVAWYQLVPSHYLQNNVEFTFQNAVWTPQTG